VAYYSRISGSDKLFVRSLESGASRQLAPTWQFGQWISLVGGTKVIFLCLSRNERGVYAIEANGGVPVLLTRSPNLWGASTDGRYLITYPTGSHLLDGINVFDTKSGEETLLASRPKTQLLSPCFSPDGRWVAIHLRNSELTRQMFVFPFHPGRATPESEWIPITAGKQLDRDPKWSPDGNLLYFLADRDGSRGIYAQRLDVVTRHPVGEPFEVKLFRSTRRSMMYFGNSGQSAPSIARDRMVFALGEMTGNIWLMKAPL
jgi:hypothetical protein